MAQKEARKMMNERFLSKAKRSNGEWVTGYLTPKDNCIEAEEEVQFYINRCGKIIVGPKENIGKISYILYPVRGETLCQCTGLKDKNGVLIFEGDILEAKLHPHYVDRINWHGKPDVIGEVHMDYCQLSIKTTGEKDMRYSDFVDVNLEESVVIGNIHDKED